MLSWFVGQRLTGLVPRERGTDLERVTELIVAGQVLPSIDRTYPLDQVPEAMRRLEAGRGARQGRDHGGVMTHAVTASLSRNRLPGVAPP